MRFFPKALLSIPRERAAPRSTLGQPVVTVPAPGRARPVSELPNLLPEFQSLEATVVCPRCDTHLCFDLVASDSRTFRSRCCAEVHRRYLAWFRDLAGAGLLAREPEHDEDDEEQCRPAPPLPGREPLLNQEEVAFLSAPDPEAPPRPALAPAGLIGFRAASEALSAEEADFLRRAVR